MLNSLYPCFQPIISVSVLSVSSLEVRKQERKLWLFPTDTVSVCGGRSDSIPSTMLASQPSNMARNNSSYTGV